MGSNNFLLGRGEELSEEISSPARFPKTTKPYSLEAASRHIAGEAEGALADLRAMPAKALPQDQVVFGLTMHPEYASRQYHPHRLFEEFDLTVVGDKKSLIKPRKSTKDGPPGQEPTRTILARCDIGQLDGLAKKITTVDKNSLVADEITHLESLGVIAPEDKLIGFDQFGATNLDLEVAIHVGPQKSDQFIVNGFYKYLKEVDVKSRVPSKLQLGGLCFAHLIITNKSALEKVAKFGFVRFIRPMPYVKPITRSAPLRATLPSIPTGEPLDTSTTAAVFDGGIPEDETRLGEWVNQHETEDKNPKPANAEDVAHGLGVTSALLFGPIDLTKKELDRPPCFVAHHEVMRSGVGQTTDEISILSRIKKIADSGGYDFINLSLGPPGAMDDDYISPWTSFFDGLAYRDNALITVASGNDGDLDQESGNSRIQPPSDGVNVLCVGASRSIDGDVARASYSSYGPGRMSAIVKPETVSFGGSQSDGNPFYCLGGNGGLVGQQGTSFAAPVILRTALSIRSFLGDTIKPLALKALLVHAAAARLTDGRPSRGHGWGSPPVLLEDIVTTEDHAARILYQGSLAPYEWVRFPIPLPPDMVKKGYVKIGATLCYFSETNPENAYSYTRSGMEVVFRPNASKKTRVAKKKSKHQEHPDSDTFFGKDSLGDFSPLINHQERFWETTRSALKTKRASSLDQPAFDLRYLIRGDTEESYDQKAPHLKYAMVVTVSAPQCKDLYDRIQRHYQQTLQAFRPKIEVPVRV